MSLLSIWLDTMLIKNYLTSSAKKWPIHTCLCHPLIRILAVIANCDVWKQGRQLYLLETESACKSTLLMNISTQSRNFVTNIVRRLWWCFDYVYLRVLIRPLWNQKLILPCTQQRRNHISLLGMKNEAIHLTGLNYNSFLRVMSTYFNSLHFCNSM